MFSRKDHKTELCFSVGVRLPHRVILNRLQWQFRSFPYSQTEKVCVFKTALTFVDSVCEIWGPLISGLSILVVPKALTKDPEKLVNLIDEYQVRIVVFFLVESFN